MDTTDDKEPFRQVVETAERKLAALPEGGPIRTWFRRELLKEASDQIEHTPARDLEFGSWGPPFLVFLWETAPDAIAELDRDLELVLERADNDKSKQLVQFLQAKRVDSRTCHSGLFDVWSRATLIRQDCSAVFDAPLPNGRDTDIRLEISEGRFVRLENTVITEDDEDRAVWAKYCEAKRDKPDEILIRPGKYDPPNAKGPSLYYNARRIYPKVYDKLAQDLDPTKSQCAENEPNVILLSFAGRGVDPSKPGYGCALDFLFTPWFASDRDQEEAAGIPDVSLRGWLEHHAGELCGRGDLTDEQFVKRYSALVEAPRKLGGIMLFNNCLLHSARVNYNAHEQCSLSHAEMAKLEKLYCCAPAYTP